MIYLPLRASAIRFYFWFQNVNHILESISHKTFESSYVVTIYYFAGWYLQHQCVVRCFHRGGKHYDFLLITLGELKSSSRKRSILHNLTLILSIPPWFLIKWCYDAFYNFSSIGVSSLEPEIQEKIKQLGKPIDKVYYNKGL